MPQIPEPVADWLATQTALEFCLTILAIFGVVYAAWTAAKKAFPGIKRGVEFIDSLLKLPDFMKTTTDSLAEVKHEVLPNNGGSLRDENVTLGLRLEKVEAKLGNDFERLAAIEDELRIREERGIGIPRSTVSPRLNALPSRRSSRNAMAEDLADTDRYPREELDCPVHPEERSHDGTARRPSPRADDS